ncbi:MAG: phosphoadenylyl-sulfate reductase [Gammaproteobacteria bacterium]|nr:phosphoadenylyl-sulfate reductase [Gammaproteobacteria bacterium]
MHHAVKTVSRDISVVDEHGSREQALSITNNALQNKSPEERVAWSMGCLPGVHAVTSSFGAQAAVMLRLVTLAEPGIPVILIDTGYLFAETYRFIDELTHRLQLNLKVYRPDTSAAWQEARYGQRWDQGIDGIKDYNTENKVAPMERALVDLDVSTWFAGLRRSQSSGRAGRQILEGTEARWKVHPVIDQTDRDIHKFLKHHNLPYHPLWEKGYLSIGDYHSTRSVLEVSDHSELRFQGLTRECGIHEIDLAKL